MTMQKRQLGRSGLMVSPFTLGSMEFGSKVSEAEAQSLFDMALERGINVIDTANCYAGGKSEEIVGGLIAKRRSKVLLATKFSVQMDADDANSVGTSRHNVIEACEASLKRLKTDHIDMFYIHRPFTQNAIDETLRALDDLVRAGKVRTIGSSSFAAWQMIEAAWCAKENRLNRLAVEQTPYHILDRRIEREVVPAAATYGIGLTIWSPLAGGLLTGKYLSAEGRAASRLSPDNDWGAKHFTPQADAAVARLDGLAKKLGTSMTAMSLAWTLGRPGVGSIVLGPRNREQFEQQLSALAVDLSGEALAEIDQIAPPGRAIVPYYLDDAFADFRPHKYGW